MRLAIEVKTGRQVALKIVRTESEMGLANDGVTYKDVLNAMKLEVQYANALGNHPNIVHILGVAEGGKVFVMEKAVADLHSWIKRNPKIRLGLAKHWSRGILSACRYMHDVGIMHLDVKASNVLIFADQTAKLCDFGLACRGRDSKVVNRELMTLWYRAPELLMGAMTFSPIVDEWGVGCVMLEMIIGCAPFQGNTECRCACDEITHCNFNSDQLMRIFHVLGTPEDAAFLSRMTCSRHFSKWSVFPPNLQQMVTPCATSLFLSKCVR